ncbi:MAG: ABC transporter ATP-binding protein [Elusimicrobia bacterium GWA2_56_46]|nr:MAG: ABC transporter ATP-binding protein [Elusimicrobia bacterium GWA2_56_46]OGR54661.1 MAG: ABC transporter ATP-binding protein [Elusimicrobia bacterium GWC2_56_31]HBB66769.1 ABC transporter ATP-binding protein [Elusimicrobiota bacterium]HBW21973.1 ABC transporter ATP-binding protein [Elusimicrobiota bacterium]
MIEIKGLSKIYSGKKVLDNAGMVINDGDIFSVIGPSGCGKSTLLKCIVRLIKPDSGEILVDGKNVVPIEDEFELARVRKDFGYLFQSGALFDSLTVMENVTFGLQYLTDIPKREYPRIAREKLALVGLEKAENLKPAELSGGMKKRAALARAIAAEPKYIFYDEPTTGLDPITSDMVMGLISDMAAKLKITSIIVTHDIKLAFTISTRIAMLYNGNFNISGTPEELRKSSNPVFREFTEDALFPDVQGRRHDLEMKHQRE